MAEASDQEVSSTNNNIEGSGLCSGSGSKNDFVEFDDKSNLPTSTTSDDLSESSMASRDNFTLGTLKKDDSGIDMEKSPTTSTKEMSDAECSESLNDSAACSQSESVSDVKWEDVKAKSDETSDVGIDSSESTGMRDCNDTDDSENVATSNMTESPVASPSHDVSDTNIVADDSETNTGSPGTRKRRHERSNSSSSDSEDSDNETADTSKKKESESESEDEMDIDDDGIKPRHKWRAVSDLRDREYGYTNRSPPSIFREKIHASLQMVQRLKLQYRMEYHEGCVNALHFNRIGTLLASGSDDLNIVLWNWLRNRPALVYDSGHRSNVFQAKFMPYSGDCHVVSCARDGQVRLAELSLTGVCKGTKKLAQHKGAAHKLALEFDSPHLFLSCGEDAMTYEMDLRQDKPNKLITTKENDRKVALYSIHSNPRNSFEFCVGGRDHFIRVYDKRRIAEDVNGGVLKKFCPHHLLESDVKANVTCACYNYNGTEVLGTYNDEDIYLFNNLHSDGAEFTQRYRGHRNNATVKGVNFYGPKSEYIVSGSDCGHVFLWDKETAKIVNFMEGDEGGVINVLEPHPIAPILATSGLDHDVKVWAPTAEEPTRLKGLRKAMKQNCKERDEERTQEPEMIDGQMLWFIMHHFRRSARRRLRQEGEEVSSSSENSDSDSDEEEAEDTERLQCTPS
ncbi:DDB1- and CUL4-associated factor 8-like [Haliotis asinina]|uniref:DDB1- and CUL4-associated factor 8-like n=1 Tax=Haliotis asinina TaxID=109174 RepID=UPI003531C718